MSALRSPTQAIELMAHETRVAYSAVPRELGGIPVEPGFRLFSNGQFLLRCESGYGYHYVPGGGVTIERPASGDPDEETLWLYGSVYSAIACLNGFYPVHASAVAHRGHVIAFTGPSGAGKSTLVAGLGQRGLPMFCDDTLLLDLSDPERIIALPGHKRLKLTEHALELTSAHAEQPVGADTGKSYAAPPAGDVREALPLASLVFLETGSETTWHPITGAERFARLADDHYTQDLYRESRGSGRAEQFALRARLATQVSMARLARPISKAGYVASLDLVEAMLRDGGEESME